MKIQRILAGISSLAIAGSMIAAFPAVALAEESGMRTAADAMVWMKEKANYDFYGILSLQAPGPFSMYRTTDVGTYTVDNPKNLAAAPAQEHFDLRDVDGKNYVTPVKYQNPFGTCWAFAATAAAEVSVAYEAGIDLNTATEEERNAVDFSERHLAYFAGCAMGENLLFPSQAGEGNVRYKAEKLRESGDYSVYDYNDAYFNTGGVVALGSNLYSAFMGPAKEADAPYQNDEGTLAGTVRIVEIIKEPDAPIADIDNLKQYAVKESIEPVDYHSPEELDQMLSETLGELNLNNLDWYKGNGKYYYRIHPMAPDMNGTWVLDESLRFDTEFELESSCILPTPCVRGEDGSYSFNVSGINAIKNELINGRAVSISYHADQSEPGDLVKTDSFMSFIDKNGKPTADTEQADYWCQYTFDPDYQPDDPESINKVLDVNHAVTIVGYDDNIPKEYFRDPNGTIGGDGAFIVKNSWGDRSISDEGWGNAGTGYFYLSYYDQSIRDPESFDFNVLTEERVKQEKYSAVSSDMYDLLPTRYMDEMTFVDKVSMANVFKSRIDSQLRSVGYTAVSCNEEVSYDIYLLNENPSSPTDGVLAGHAEETYLYGGYQRTQLDQPITIREGQLYSVVATVKREDGNYGVGVKTGYNKSCVDGIIGVWQSTMQNLQTEEEKEIYQSNIDELTDVAQYAACVVNPGESYLYADGEWTDWSEMIKTVQQDDMASMFEYDNFGIKVYADSEIINVVNEVKTPRDSYQAGDKVDCQVTVINSVMRDLENLSFTINGEEWTSVEKLPMTETTVLEYQYTVTEEDVKKGSFSAEVQAFIQIAGETYEIDLKQPFSVTVLEVSLTNAPTEPSTEAPVDSTESTEPTETQPASGTEAPTEAKTYTADRICEMAVKDYEVRTGVKPEKAEYTAESDGSLTVTLTGSTGKVLDTYKISKHTATGKNSEGQDIDLPQTGNNNAADAAAAAAAACLTAAGAFLFAKSLRRKKD